MNMVTMQVQVHLALPCAKHLQVVLLCPFVKWPVPCGIPPFFIHLYGCQIPCYHAAVHDEEAHNCQGKGCIQNECQEQYCWPAKQSSSHFAAQTGWQIQYSRAQPYSMCNKGVKREPSTDVKALHMPTKPQCVLFAAKVCSLLDSTWTV